MEHQGRAGGVGGVVSEAEVLHPAEHDVVVTGLVDGVHGAVDVPGLQLTPSNFSSPLVAMASESPCWPRLRMLTQKWPARCIRGQARDVRAGQNSTSGGESETELKD
jgi:hypothetical protein